MAGVRLLSTGSTGVLTSSGFYFPLGNSGGVQNAPFTVEANAQVKYRTGGTLSNFYLRIPSGGNNTNGTVTATIRKNGVNTTMTVSVGAFASGEFEDTTDTLTVASGDLLNYGIGGVTNTIFTVFGCTFDVGGTSGLMKYVSGNGIFSVDSVSYYTEVSGLQTYNQTESNMRARLKTAGTFQNMYVYVSANARTTTSTITALKNGAATTMTVSIGSASTGVFEDITHTFTVVSGDDVDWQLTMGGGAGQSITIPIISVEMSMSSSAFMLVAGDALESIQFSANSDYAHFAVAGDVDGNHLNEKTSRLRLVGAVNNLTTRVPSNTLTSATTTVTFVQNGTGTSLQVSIGAGLTGEFEDSTHSVSVVATDEVEVHVNTANVGSGQIVMSGWSMLFSGTTTASGTMKATLSSSRSTPHQASTGSTTVKFSGVATIAVASKSGSATIGLTAAVRVSKSGLIFTSIRASVIAPRGQIRRAIILETGSETYP